MKLCKTLAILLLPCLFGAGCGLDKGSSGDIPPENVFLVAQGCLADDPSQGQAGTKSYSFTPPLDLSLMEARLEVLRGEVDIVVGTEDPPSDYFAFGRGPGTQKILVGRDSREPIGEPLRPWFVQLVSPFEIRECEEGDDPDWRLSVRQIVRDRRQGARWAGRAGPGLHTGRLHSGANPDRSARGRALHGGSVGEHTRGRRSPGGARE